MLKLSTPQPSDAKHSYVSISAVRRGEDVRVTLSIQNNADVYVRTYDCVITADDEVIMPNDLNSRTQTMLRGVCTLAKYPNTYEGDS